MHRLRNNRITLTALLLVALLPLLAGSPGLVWRSAEGRLCVPCTFAEPTTTDNCCDSSIRAAVTDNCRQCCTADKRQESPRTLLAADTLVTLPQMTDTPAPLLRAYQPLIVTPFLLPIHRTFLHGPPCLRAPPPSPV